MIGKSRALGFFAGAATMLLSGCDKTVNKAENLLPPDTVKAFAARLNPVDTSYCFPHNKTLPKFPDTSDIKQAISTNPKTKIKKTYDNHYVLVEGQDFSEYDSKGASLKRTHYSSFDKSSETVTLKKNIEDHSIEYHYDPANFYFNGNSGEYVTGGAVFRNSKDAEPQIYPVTGKAEYQ